MNTVVVISYFIIYSFFGWILESVYKTAHQKEFINSGFLAGPFCPIYGCGALIMYFILDRFHNNYILLFIFGFIILSILEYIVGLFLELIFKTKYWDYSEKKFNIQGRVCLINSIYWGILGIVFIKVIHPLVEDLISIIPNNYLIVFVSIIGAYILVDTIITATNLIKVNIKVFAIDDLNNKIKSRLEKFNTIKSFNKTKVLRGIVKIKRRNKLAIIELEQKKVDLINKIERQTKRIRKAFPSMKSDRILNIIKHNKNEILKDNEENRF